MSLASGAFMKTLLALVPMVFFALFSVVVHSEFTPRGIIMIDKRGSLVRFFNPITFEEISNLAIDGTPHELALSPDRNTAYVPNYGDGVYGNNPNPGHSIAVIDLNTRQVRNTIDISPYRAPHGIDVDGNGILYVSCDLSRTLLVIDPSTLAVTAAIDILGTGHWVSVLPDGSKAYVANKNDKLFVSVIDLRQQQIIKEIPMPNGTQGIAVSPDGRFVLAMDMSEPRIRKIDTATDTAVEDIVIADNKGGAWDAKYSPDGQWVVSVNARERTANVYQGDLKSSRTTLSVGSQPFGIEFTPDSRTVLVSNHGDGSVSVIDLADNKVTKTFTAGTGIETLAFY
jgi:YVTN family beta-propeller protein